MNPLDRFTIGGPLRAALGLVLLAGSIAVLWRSRSIDWGVAWTAIVPALVLMIPAWALLQRRVLRWDQGALRIIDGWLWRRELSLRIVADQAWIDVVTTAGLRAVVLHVGNHQHPLATWITRRRADQLCEWLQACAGLPCRTAPLPERDR
jgi:hypothetical protein